MNDEYTECVCGCGTLIHKYTLRGDIRRYAPNHQLRQPLDLSGRRFGKLQVIRQSTKRTIGHNSRFWECQCDCGDLITMRSDTLQASEYPRCRACRIQSQKEKVTKNDRDAIALNGLYLTYRRTAKRRKLEFTLSPEECSTLFLSHCYYCGIGASAQFKTYYKPTEVVLAYNGIDRVNNDQGYTPENSVPCCQFCNRAKHTMTHDAYIALCKRVAQTHKGDQS